MELYNDLKQFGRVRANVLLSKYTTFKIGGPAQFLVEVEEVNLLIGLLDYLSGEGVDFLIIGGGTNLLLPDDGFVGVVIKIKNHKSKIINNEVEIGSGAMLGDLVNASIQAGLTGLEWAAGIPGTVGGAVRGNAGAHYAFSGGEMKDSISSIKVWQDGEVNELAAAECHFGYRDSFFKHTGSVVLSARFALNKGNKQQSMLTVQKILEERKGKHASEPSAGSFFKNVMLDKWTHDLSELPERFTKYEKIAAGWLIDQAGLNGFKSGGAMVAPAHGNFIINVDGATQNDVLAIVDEVKTKVYNRFGIELEEEVQIIH